MQSSVKQEQMGSASLVCLATQKKPGYEASEKLLIVQLPRTARTC